MHNDPNDRLSKQFQKQPADAKTKPRGDRDDEGNLKLGDLSETKEESACETECKEAADESKEEDS